MKKILQVCAIDLSIEALLKPLIQALAKEGYIVHSACTDTGKFEALRQQQLTVINIPIKRKISLWSNLQSVWNLYQLIKKEKYDIVHVHTPIAAILGRIAAKLAGTPHIIYTAHGFYFHEGMSKYQYCFFYFLEKYFARYATDWLLLQSREDYELCLAKSFKDKDKIIHISNGIDIFHKFNPVLIEDEARKEIRKDLGIEEGSIVFSFIGRFVREKGIFELIEAFQRMKQEFPSVRLLMIGDSLTSERDQESYQRLKELLNDESIITPGFRKDIPELLASSDVFVLPSYREGLPRSIIEAMAMEKPIIATNIRGCREEVFPEENGFLVEKADVEDLYEKMVILCADKEKREKFGRCSRKIVEESFNEEKVIDKQLSLFRRLIGE